MAAYREEVVSEIQRFQETTKTTKKTLDGLRIGFQSDTVEIIELGRKLAESDEVGTALTKLKNLQNTLRKLHEISEK